MKSYIILFGGRGAAGKGKEPFFNLASNMGGAGAGDIDFPARFNALGVRDEKKTVQIFKDKHNLDKEESSIVIDRYGFVHGYTYGTTSSGVPYHGRLEKGATVVHNHPRGTAFSRADIRVFAMDSRIDKLYATGSKGTYVIEKTNKFDAKGLMNDLSQKKVRIDSDKNYSNDIKRILGNKTRQKKYGYRFSYTND